MYFWEELWQGIAMSHWELEEGMALQLDFDKLSKVASCGHAVIPVVVQEAKTLEVLILAYVNRQALEHSLKTRIATFWSTSRGELWIKGASSGDTLDLVEVRVNCEQNSLLFLVHATTGNSCHTGRSGCYYRSVLNTQDLDFAAGQGPKNPA
jgi:phosphoribosyl-AMP cyclohydrolase